ncbi:MAG TPA: hypothetical protein VKB50_08675 [Vicinamibacterales bacterium]|nr:hypothetical protein [Vicinamibacterales bacterium]
MALDRMPSVVALIVVSTLGAAAQVGGKLVVGGNPTPGTEQPAPPALSDRVALTGCLRAAPKSAGATETPDPNVPSGSRFVLIGATRVDRLPPGTGGSELATATSSPTYRLEGLESQFSPFVNAKVEISGEIKPPTSEAPASNPPTLSVEFVQKLASTCK